MVKQVYPGAEGYGRSTDCPAGDPCPGTGCPACCPSYDRCGSDNCVICNTTRSNMTDKRTDAEVAEHFAALPKKHDEMAAQVAGIAQKTKETLDNMSRRYISEDMLQTVAGAMGEHSAPALLYVGTDGKVTRVDWEALGEDDREIEIFLGLLRIAAGRHIDWNAPSTEALRPTARRCRG